jgi:hypothetical protein
MLALKPRRGRGVPLGERGNADYLTVVTDTTRPSYDPRRAARLIAKRQRAMHGYLS